MKYKKHLFLCTNERADGRQCCGEKHGMMLVNEFKNLIKENNIQAEVRAQRAGCFDTCEHGPAIVVYPEGIFYGKVQKEDVEEIFTSHILNNQPVERLIIDFKKNS